MKSYPWFRFVGASMAVVAAGIGIDTARAQFPMCQTPIAGCPNLACYATSGTCVGGPMPPAYTAAIQQNINYTPCNVGPTNNCPNRQVPACTVTFFTGTVAQPCLNLKCTATGTIAGC